MRLHRRRAARGGPARAGLLRRRPLALLALRPGRLAGPRPLERAAHPHRAHPRQGQERGAGRRRPARAARPRHRRGAGGRRGRPADRQHRRGGPPAGPPLRRRPRAARSSSRPASTSTGSRPATGPPPAAPSACPRTPSCCSSSAASSRSRRPTSCCTPPPSCSPTTRRCAPGSACTSSARPAAPASTRPEQLQKLAGDLGIADVVRFFPPQPPERLADHYRAADVAVVPSHNESFGLVALEAQACGTPVVAAAVGGLRDGGARRRLRRARRRPRPGATTPPPSARCSPGGSCSRPAPAGTPAQFSWDRTADALVAAYASAAEEMAGAPRPVRAPRRVGPLRAAARRARWRDEQPDRRRARRRHRAGAARRRARPRAPRRRAGGWSTCRAPRSSRPSAA